MSDTIEVIFCTDGIFPHAVGGMQRHSLLLIEKLAQYSDLQITVIHPHQGKKLFNAKNIREVTIAPADQKKMYLAECYSYSRKVYDVIAANPMAIVYSQGLSVWHGINRLPNKIIINPHGLESYQTLSVRDYLIGVPFRLIFNYLFKKSTKVVSLGGRLTDIIRKVTGPKKICVLPNAVNIPEQAPERDNTTGVVKFLFVGRFALNKGINILAEAVKELNAEGYEQKLEFNLVGKGPLFDEYKTKYPFANLHFLGFADDDRLNELYRTNDIFVLPTLFEGMPTVVLEAMAHRMPVIVTDVGATRELVDEQNGFIIEKNNVRSLKDAIIRFTRMPQSEKNIMFENSYQKVKGNFTWDKVAERHYQLFRELHTPK